MLTREQVTELVERMLKQSGRRLDVSTPFVDAQLPGGHRLHVVLQGVSRGYTAVNIRKFVVRAATLPDLVRLGSLRVGNQCFARIDAGPMRRGAADPVGGAGYSATRVTPGGETVANNSHLITARDDPNDEFYTQWADIEREMNAYLEYDPDVFRDKVVLLPCDDPEWSNFTKFFALHFVDFGLKRLISTSFAPDSNPAGDFYQPSLFESESDCFDEAKDRVRGKKFVLEAEDANGDGVIDIDDLRWDYLEGDGSFKSAEVTALRDAADFVITNPPFSRFVEFLTWILEGDVKFAIVGPDAAVTYKDVFPHVMGNRVWKGATGNNTDMVFRVPNGVVVKDADRAKAARMGYESNDEATYTRLGNSCWFTNIDHGRRHAFMQLMTQADNIQFSKYAQVRGVGYRKYENYDAIEVPKTAAIPSDYDGLMGVPIGFLNHYNPDQFEIVGTLESSDPKNPGRTKWYTQEDQKAAYLRRFGKEGSIPLNMSGVIDDVKVFKRILIRKRKADADGD